jgi:uncharacterized delta-60 repeat protein
MIRMNWASTGRPVRLMGALLICMASAASAQDGALDAGYGVGAPLGTASITVPGMVTESARTELSGTGHTWVASTFTRTDTPTSSAAIVRFTPSGQLDSTFNAGVTPGYHRLFLAGPDGVSDFTSAFDLVLDNPANPTAAFVLVQGSAISPRSPATPTGQAFADLERPTPFTTRYGQYIAVSKVKADGTLDTTFGSFGHSYVAQGSVSPRDIVRDPQGGLIVLSNADDSSAYYLTRLGANGAVDASFGEAGTARIAGPSGSMVRAMSMIIDRQGRIVVVGTLAPASATQNWEAMIFRAQASGQPDSGFGVGGMRLTAIDVGGDNADVLNHVAIDAQDRIVAAGGSHTGDAFVSASCTALRATSDGTNVRTFVLPNSIAAHCTVAGVAVSGNGRILLAARLQNIDPPVKAAVVALDSSSFTLDRSFGSAGVGQPPEYMLDAFPMDLDLDAQQRPLMTGVHNDQVRALFVARYAQPDKLLSDSFE